MALEKQTISIPFSQGLDTKSDPKQLSFGKLTAISNGYFQTPGEIRKRNGFDQLTKNIEGGGSLSNAVALSAFQDSLVEMDGKSVYSYAPNRANWIKAHGILEPIDLSQRTVYRSPNYQQLPNSAFDPVSGLQIFIWSDAINGIQYSIVDSADGSIVIDGMGTTFTGSPSIIRPIVLGSYFVLFADDGSTGLNYRALTISSLTMGSLVSLATDLTTAHMWDVTPNANGNIYIAYDSSHGTQSIAVGEMAASLSYGAIYVASEKANTGIAIWCDTSSNVWIGYANSTPNVKYFVYNSALNIQITAPQIISSNAAFNLSGLFISNISSGLCYTVYTSSDFQVSLFGIDTAGGVSNLNSIKSICLVSKAILYNAEVFFVGEYAGLGSKPVQPTFFLINANMAIPIAKFAVNSAFAMIPTSPHPIPTLPVNINMLNASTFECTLAVIASGYPFSVSTYPFFQGAFLSYNFTFGLTPQIVEIANNLNISGGFVSIFDGANVCELGFHVFPEMTHISTGSGGSIADGSYIFYAIYNWIDNQGNQQISAPSLPITVVVSGGGGSASIVMNVTTLRLSGKNLGSVGIQIYRTLANGTIAHLEQVLVNDGNVNVLSFTDLEADTDIQGNLQIYTAGGEVQDISPPAVSGLWTYKNRLMAIQSEAPNVIWYSKQVLSGFAAEFSDLFTLIVDQKKGSCIAGSQLDDKCIFFKENGPFLMLGDGPAPNGTGNDFTTPQVIASDVGALEFNSVLLTDRGLMFRGTKGLCLLDRSLAVQFIGVEAEGINSQPILSSSLVSMLSQARFTQANGTAIVYDYLVNQWTEYTPIPGIGSCIFQEQYTWVDSTGQVWQGSAGFSDGAAQVQLSLTTGWLNLSSLQGFMRVYKAMILGEFKSTHTLEVSVGYDFNPNWVQIDNISATASLPYQFRIMLTRQKCQAIRFRIRDLSDTTEAFSISAIAFEVGVKKGLNKLPNSQTYG